ncbi:MAG: hypothetical protein HKN47_24990 [Pirellulaceae bacterium]|nr:hypothetical protein [Pirellulaceae bacterium]
MSQSKFQPDQVAERQRRTSRLALHWLETRQLLAGEIEVMDRQISINRSESIDHSAGRSDDDDFMIKLSA